MKRISLYSLFLFLFTTLFFSCEKEKSYENGGAPVVTTSVFTLGGAPSSCTGFVVSGTYMAGLALAATNSIAIDVTVTTVGSYTISTAAVNGVTFSSSGSFTSTGAQTVILQGTGIPTTSGDFNYTITNSAGNCSFVLPVIPAAPPATGTLDCTGITSSGTYTQGIALGTSNTVSIPVNVATAGTYSITTTAANGCIFSGAGLLAAGAQTIVLSGSGTPASAGSIDFPVSFGTSNCTIPINFLPGSNPGTDYIRCKIDGVAKTFNDGALAVDIFGTLLINGTENASSPNTGNFSITLSNAVDLVVNVGSYPNLPPMPGNLCMIAYIPDAGSAGTGWGSATAGQSGGFTVSVTAITTNRITGTFSGTLYDSDGTGTATKTVTNGEFSVPK